MSWDFSMEAPPCPTCGHRESDDPNDGDEERLEADYTYNVAPMFNRAFTTMAGEGNRGLNGMTGESAAAHLLGALSEMRACPAVYREMNPPNGWGSYEGAIELLAKLRGWCLGHPTWTLRVS